MRRTIFTALVAVAAGGCGPEGSYAPVSGRVTMDGRFTLLVVGRTTAGAVVGSHRVTISKPVPPADPSKDEPVPDLVPAKYNTKSKLTYEVPRGGSEGVEFDLASK